MKSSSDKPDIQSKDTDINHAVKQDKALELSIVLPVYQEINVIDSSIKRLIHTLRKSDISYEIIVVDDGSTDGTLEVLQELSSKFADKLRVISHPYNKGNGAAIKTGINNACGATIACMDADGQHDPEDLFRMLHYRPKYDMVVGARTKDYKGLWYRNLGNKLYSALASWLARFKIEDLTSGYRLFNASVVKQYTHLFPPRFSYPTTSTLAFIKGGYNVKYVPIKVSQRTDNSSKIKIIRDGLRFLVIIFKIIVIFEPLRVFIPTALIFFLLAFISTAYSILSLGRLYIPNSGGVLFIVGVLVVLLGLIAEQLAALQVMHHERKEK